MLEQNFQNKTKLNVHIILCNLFSLGDDMAKAAPSSYEWISFFFYHTADDEEIRKENLKCTCGERNTSILIAASSCCQLRLTLAKGARSKTPLTKEMRTRMKGKNGAASRSGRFELIQNTSNPSHAIIMENKLEVKFFSDSIAWNLKRTSFIITMN